MAEYLTAIAAFYAARSRPDQERNAPAFRASFALGDRVGLDVFVGRGIIPFIPIS